MHALTLYARYALRSFIRGRSRSIFGAFCVAVGIASVVGLGLAAGDFRNSVTADTRKQNRGDVSASAAGLGFTRAQYRIFAELKARGEISDYTAMLQDDNIVRNPRDRSLSTVGQLYAVDPAKFPFYDSITADTPARRSLAALLANPGNAVVGHDTLDTLHLNVGDSVTVNSRRGFNHTYRIAGVVPDSAPNPGFGSGFWNDFVMVNDASMLPFFHGMDVAASAVYMKTPSTAMAARVKATLEAHLGGFPQVKTVADVENDSKNEAAGFDKFFRIMSLVAVVIGGIGIVNTMLVAARRRTREIAVLKSLGMKGRQVVLAFTFEALLLAIAGTAVGLLLGIGASVAVTSVTQNLAGFAIPWSLQAEPLIAGVFVGVVATLLFSYLPILAASRARPIAALRTDLGGGPKTAPVRALFRNLRRHPVRTLAGVRHAPMGLIRLPRRQGFRTTVLVIVLAGLMGTLGVLYSDLASGVGAVLLGCEIGIGVLVGALVITQLFVAVVWLVSKLPTFGRLPLRMAFRSMGTQKRRLGSTLLALCVGILAVGSVSILAQNLKSAAVGFTHQIKVSALVQTPHDPATIRRLNAEVAGLPGIKSRDYGSVANGAALISVDGKDPNALLQAQIRSHRISRDDTSNAAYSLRGLEGRDTRVNHYPLVMVHGRNLGQADAGTDHIVMNNLDRKYLGVHIGSTVVFQDGSRRVPFTVVGLYDANASFAIMANNEVDLGYMRRTGLTVPSPSHLSELYLNMRDDVVQANIARIRRDLTGVTVLDIGSFLANAVKAVDKVTLFPEIIAALSLFAGVIIIGNTVALAMLERRREIGVIKAVGARRRTILEFLLVENAIVGFLGAGAGVLLAMLATAVLDGMLLKITPEFSLPTIGGLLLLGIGLAMGASALTATPASRETPMTVLRYE